LEGELLYLYPAILAYIVVRHSSVMARPPSRRISRRPEK